jgi:hypothetical protein
MPHVSMLERLLPEDQQMAKRWLGRMLAAYFWLTLFLVGGVALRIALDSQGGVAGGARQAEPGLFGAMTAEPSVPGECARRDLRALAAIEGHGEAQDVPSAKLAEASFTVLRARAVCSEGAVDAALAMYDGIRFAPGVATD